MTRRRELDGAWGSRIYWNHYNLNSFCLRWLEFTGKFDMPVLERCDRVPDQIFPYDERNKYKTGMGAVHFYCEDAEFESVWLRANRYPHLPPVLQKAGIALTPDFSLFTDFPLATQIWNVYRSRLLGALWHHCGLDVIPSVVWGLPESYEWCFDGLPDGGTVAIATTHVRTPGEQALFVQGFDEMLRRCKPGTVMVYGRRLKGILEQRHPNVRRYDSRISQLYEQRKLEKANES